jgi:hypothetical protein
MFERLLNRQPKDLSTMEENVESGRGSVKMGRRVYYYVGAMYNGQPAVLGRYFTYEQAEQMGKQKLGDIPFRVYPKTCDMRTATKEIKYDLLSPNNIDDVMNRAKHTIEPDEE